MATIHRVVAFCLFAALTSCVVHATTHEPRINDRARMNRLVRSRQLDDSLTGRALYRHQQNGKATWYTQDGERGSCGWWRHDSDLVVALPQSIGPDKYCGRRVHIVSHQHGRTIVAQAVDTCPSCDAAHLDLSTGAFKALSNGDLDQGVLPISWTIL